MKLSTVQLKAGKMYILFSYEQLMVDKNILPPFISLRPNRHFIVTLDKSLDKSKLKELFKVLTKWFSRLKAEESRQT
jgi:hypothetical protein